MTRATVVVLEDGFAIQGERAGNASESTGELVFNTCMTGYQEVLSDPSYAGQMLVMTYPLIGNYGISQAFLESERPWARALITRSLSVDAFHWRSQSTLRQWLDAYDIPIVSGVDTRRLVRHLRNIGATRAVVAPISRRYAIDELSQLDEVEALVERARAVTPLEQQDLVGEVSAAFLDREEALDHILLPAGARQWPGVRITVVDFGVKRNLLRSLRARGARVDVVAHDSTAEAILSHHPDAVVLSNGPGDPARLQDAVLMVQRLLGRVPMLGVCLGHQLIGLAAGGRTSRLRFGHHGGNHPVLDVQSARVSVTSQNHEFQVEGESIPPSSGFFVSHRNLNDGSVEGLAHRSLPVRSVQFHPEGAPGPQDNQHVFDEFLELVIGHARQKPVNVAAVRPPPASVLVIGSGPIVIGQAAEFDYAGTQACKALREEGIRTILVNSNPATIMTDEETADRVYIEPLSAATIEAVIARERPEGLLATLGGQTALNLAVELDRKGVLDRYGVRVLGTSLKAIRTAEDRAAFKQLLAEIGEPVPASRAVTSAQDAEAFAEEVGFPLVVRPSFCLGGSGGGTATSREELIQVVSEGIATSPIGQVLVERALHGWKEVEYEVMRDAADTCIAICNMENLDPMGVHTGDSIVVAPSQTLSDRQYQMLRSAALRIIRALHIEGGCNVQFALEPMSDAYYVIEVNPRVSRSSALASKATGYPIARVAAKIAIGRRLHEIPNAITGRTTAAFEPALDYCVVKIPRWPFDKFPLADRSIGTQMKSTGEVMAIERTFEAALKKAVRALEQHEPDAKVLSEQHELLAEPNDRRLFAAFQALRDGLTVAQVSHATGYSPWFVSRMADVVRLETELATGVLDAVLYRRAKRAGLSDEAIARFNGNPVAAELMAQRPTYREVDTCAAEFEATTPYYYGTYEDEDEVQRSPQEAVMVVGSGPIRIGQGIEFDYCSVHASAAVRQAGFASVLVNSNPETVSTDFDASTRLYFEPLDREGVLKVLQREQPAGVLVQFGGQTALNLARAIGDAGIPVLGSSVEAIDLAEDRLRCDTLLGELGIPRPVGGAARSIDDALALAQRIGYPIMIRPSYVLGGRAVEIIYSAFELRRYLDAAGPVNERGAILIDRYLAGRELEVDAVSDGTSVVVPGILEHVERAGVHSGDSFAVYPPVLSTVQEVDQILAHTLVIARAFGVVGLINIQFVVYDGVVYVLEVNPRASRTVPFLSKVTGVPMVRLGTLAALGRRLTESGYGTGLVANGHVRAVKAPVFSMGKLPGIDPYLGPEMKSTGEEMGIAPDLAAARSKAFTSIAGNLVLGATALLSLSADDVHDAVPTLAAMQAMDIVLMAPPESRRQLIDAGLNVVPLLSLNGGSPDAVEMIRAGYVQLVFTTDAQHGPGTGSSNSPDSYDLRRAAVERQIPCITSLDTARALVDAIAQGRKNDGVPVATIGEYVGDEQYDRLISSTVRR
jgi:carbamoyl-phosphate synthase large subunit